GRAGPWTVGALNVVTEQTTLDDGEVEPQTLWSVISLRRNILSRSSVGVLVTSKDPHGGESDQTFGVDTNLALGNFTSVRTQLATVSGADAGNDSYAYTGSFNFDTDLWQVRLNTQRIGEDFDPQMGFLRRGSIRESEVELEYAPRPEALGIRQVTLTTQGSYLTDLDNRLLTRELQLRTSFFMENTSNVFLTFSRQFELEPDGFTVYTDPDDDSTVDVAPGAYEWSKVSLRGRSDGRGSFSLGGGGSWAVGWWGGRQLSGNLDLTWRPVPNSSNTISVGRNAAWDLQTPGRDHFIANTLSLRVNYAFTPRLFTKAYVQLNDARNAIVSNYLLHWIVRDGTEVYLVYNEQYDTGEGFEPFATNRTLILKATYLLLW
ncbi:hypothetical protein ACFL4Y_01265, partial [Gemmatimonadota bacterium]